METARVDKILDEALQQRRIVAQSVQRLITLQPLPTHHPQLLKTNIKIYSCKYKKVILLLWKCVRRQRA